ncbi:MAG TPA: signal recognition particle-docking protein FtsY [Thermoplasmatales archaeon]|nr:signal recognition particle-docking protein FtsY [Thermoplasmatales archaeon]
MFKFLRRKIRNAEDTIAVPDEQEQKKGVFGVSEKKIEELLWQLELALLEADVALEVVEEIKRKIARELAGMPRKEAREAVEASLKEAIRDILQRSEGDFLAALEGKEKPYVIMFVGVNGSGKTTSIAKMAHYLLKKGYSCVMAAGDTFRAGAIEQLELHAERLGVKLIKHDFGADPAAVAYDAIEHAKAKHKDFVLLDTAGRMQTNINLMAEMEKIKRVAQPDMIIFVGDSLTGNDAIEQAKKFNEVVGIDGVILTKVDADAKGGAALSIAHTIHKPLFFIGVGQGYDDQIPFNAEWMLKRIFEED